MKHKNSKKLLKIKKSVLYFFGVLQFEHGVCKKYPICDVTKGNDTTPWFVTTL